VTFPSRTYSSAGDGVKRTWTLLRGDGALLRAAFTDAYHAARQEVSQAATTTLTAALREVL
jgi:hypothetical protein